MIIIAKVLCLKLVKIINILKGNILNPIVIVDKILLKTIKVTVGNYLIYIFKGNVLSPTIIADKILFKNY